ncbi:hypothetical protein [Kitasatospora sp. NPDC017646]|uniref:hypothetical protein n=1 Tax=Kitasatospora sp. NPDC017646 TaxID=3364024 RepID=UPI00378AED25
MHRTGGEQHVPRAGRWQRPPGATGGRGEQAGAAEVDGHRGEVPADRLLAVRLVGASLVAQGGFDGVTR